MTDTTQRYDMLAVLKEARAILDRARLQYEDDRDRAAERLAAWTATDHSNLPPEAAAYELAQRRATAVAAHRAYEHIADMLARLRYAGRTRGGGGMRAARAALATLEHLIAMPSRAH